MVDDYDRLLKELNLKYHNASKMMSIWRSKRIHRLYENMENEKVELPVALSTLYAIATADCEHETKIIEAVREEGKSCRRSSIEAIRNGRKQVTGSLTVTLYFDCGYNGIKEIKARSLTYEYKSPFIFIQDTEVKKMLFPSDVHMLMERE